MARKPFSHPSGDTGVWRRLRSVTAAALVVSAVNVYAAQATAQDVLVFAAASLTDALQAVATRYEKRADDRIVLSFASSSMLARQIENGAPAEIYASANVQWMDYLEERALIRPRTRVDLLANRLVLIAPEDSRIGKVDIEPGFPLADLLGDGRLAMGNPAHVPAGIYGKQALKSLGVWRSVAPDVARAADVRRALALVALGEAPLGVVYRSDALAEDDVRLVGTFPEHTHPSITYPVALTVESEGQAARAFLDYLSSEEAAAIFDDYGSTPLD